MTYKIIQGIILMPLAIAAVIDRREKIIPDKINAVIASIGVINIITYKQNYKEYLLTAGIIFVVFLLLAIITDGKIGGGDIKLFTALGLTYGKDMLSLITITYIAALIFTIVKILLKKTHIKDEIPLAPYIFISALIMDIFNIKLY